MITQSDVITKFASLLGTKKTRKESAVASSLLKADPKETNSRELLMCISKSIEHHDVVCTVPSLDMRKLDEELGTNPLPKVGEHFPQMKMEASVLHNAAEASIKAAQVEQKASSSLGSLTSWTKSSVVYASSAISENAANSFSSLVDSRVRAWTLLLLRHSLTTGDGTSRTRLLGMLASSIKVNTAEIAFKAQPLPASAANLPRKDDDPDVILPLLFEIDLKLSIQSKDCNVTLRAPGTISAQFDRTEGGKMGMGLKTVDIRLDTGILLESMVKEARMVVFNAVAKATSASNSPALGSDLLKNSDRNKNNSPSKLSGFSSALILSTSARKAAGVGSQHPVANEGLHRPSHRALKAKSSSLRLSSVLSTAPLSADSSANKMKKTRSVQFHSGIDLKSKSSAIPAQKRQKIATTARLTSFKSFGRPHAGDFGSGPKNATFGDFGRSQKFWGRDGRLASHPKPMMPAETTDILTSQTRRTANATFDFQKPSIHLSGGSNSTLNEVPVPNSIPRTATALEGWLIEKTSRKRDS